MAVKPFPFQINVAKFQIATDKFDPDFIERRRQGLEVILNLLIYQLRKNIRVCKSVKKTKKTFGYANQSKISCLSLGYFKGELRSKKNSHKSLYKALLYPKISK